jgi:hypothetical protein
MTSRFGDVIKKAKEADPALALQKEIAPEIAPVIEIDDVTSKPESQKEGEPEVNLCVKVPLSLRRHWVGMAKMQGTTMTAVIVDALEARFGNPQQ